MNASKTMAALVPVGLLLLAAGCGQSKSPYTAEQAKECAMIEARYADDVVGACYGLHSLAECPDVPALRARRLAEQQQAGCR